MKAVFKCCIQLTVNCALLKIVFAFIILQPLLQSIQTPLGKYYGNQILTTFQCIYFKYLKQQNNHNLIDFNLK